MWPRRAAAKNDEDVYENEVESFNNRRLMRLGVFQSGLKRRSGLQLHFLGDDFADLVPSDAGSITSEDERSDESDDESVSQPASVSSSVTSAPSVPNALTVSAVEHEFQTEVRLSLDRAFSEGHSLENASVELKTLRMASNVPLRRVREAVVAGIVERIPVVEGAMPQRVEINQWVDRWGDLINLIGGVDGVETVSILQVSSPFFRRPSTSAHYYRLSTTAPPRRVSTCLARYSRHCTKTTLSRKRISEVGIFSRKPEAKMSGTGSY